MPSKTFFLRASLWGALFFVLEARAQNWLDPQWLKVVHYDHSFSGYNSEADDVGFFTSPDGKHHPDKELVAFIKAVEENDPDEKKNARCRFPARLRWLKKFRSLPEQTVECKNLDAFRKRLSGRSLSVVFSSYYMGNPGSAFGHTLIRIGKESLAEKNTNATSTELLDTGINYGALTNGANPVIFALGGLSGLFYGNYNAIPYYYKVREYNDSEARDLWSYQLNLTQDEIDFVVDHIWEMGHTKFQYFFLTENCSYHVLTILEAARPSLNLRRHLPRLYTIPAETLKALAKEKLIVGTTFRASQSTLFYHHLEGLSAPEKEEVYDLVFNQKVPPEHSPELSAKIYDAGLSLFDFKHADDVLKGDEKTLTLKRPILIGRSKIPQRSPKPDFTYKFKDAPHLGHGQRRLGYTLKEFDGKRFTELEWKFAFHDLLDQSTSYPPKTTIDVMKASVYSDGKVFHIREAVLVDVISLGSWDKFNKVGAWKVKLGQTQTRFERKMLTTQGVSGGYGISKGFGIFTPYAMIHGEGSYVSEYLSKMKLGIGTDTGILFDFTEQLKFLSALEWRIHPWNETRFFNELRFSRDKFGGGLFMHDYLIDGAKDMGGRVFFYF